MRKLKAFDLGDPSGTGMTFGWWAVKCVTCKTWLTKYDHSREQALAFAADSPCKCAEEQLELGAAS